MPSTASASKDQSASVTTTEHRTAKVSKHRSRSINKAAKRKTIQQPRAVKPQQPQQPQQEASVDYFDGYELTGDGLPVMGDSELCPGCGCYLDNACDDAYICMVCD